MDPNLPQQPIPVNPEVEKQPTVQPIIQPTIPQEQPVIINKPSSPVENPNEKKKSFPITFLIIIFILLISGAGGYFAYTNGYLEKLILSPQTPTYPPVVEKTETPIPTIDPTTNQETYTNTNLGFSVSIPNDWEDNYQVVTDNKSVTFMYKAIQEKPYKIFWITRTTKEEWLTIQNDPIGKQSQKLGENSIYVFYANHTLDVPYLNKENIHNYGAMAEDINQILSTFKFLDQTDETADWKEYQVKKAGLTFKAPFSYNVEISDTSEFGNKYPEKAYSFIIQDYPFNAPPPDNPLKLEADYYFNEYSPNLNDSKKGLTSVTETLVAGLPTIQGNGYGASGGTSKKQYFYTYFVKDGGLFVLASSDPNTANKEITNKILSTFKFEK